MPQVQQFQVNKWIRVALSLGIVVISWAAAFDWTSVLDPKTAGIIAGVLALIKAGYASFAPGVGVNTTATDGYVITQKSISQHAHEVAD